MGDLGASLNWIDAEITFDDQLQLDNQIIIHKSVNGKQICLVKQADRYLAFNRSCPHAGAHLDNGSLNNRIELTCPNHHYKFSLKTGYNVSGEGFFLKVFPAKMDSGKLWVGFKKFNLF